MITATRKLAIGIVLFRVTVRAEEEEAKRARYDAWLKEQAAANDDGSEPIDDCFSRAWYGEVQFSDYNWEYQQPGVVPGPLPPR